MSRMQALEKQKPDGMSLSICLKTRVASENMTFDSDKPVKQPFNSRLFGNYDGVK